MGPTLNRMKWGSLVHLEATMFRYLAIMAASLFGAAPSFAGELDAEFGTKSSRASAIAPQAALPVSETGLNPASAVGSELDKESPTQARRRGWGWGWRGGWNGWGWNGWGPGWHGAWVWAGSAWDPCW